MRNDTRDANGRPGPRFVARELRGSLRCGILAHGFVRVRCDGCGLDRVVAFSCKGRGFCPSCGGRRVADTAAHLVDGVLPAAPVRQWVLSLPFALRYRLTYDASLVQAVLDVFVRSVFASLRRHARNAAPSPSCSASATRYTSASTSTRSCSTASTPDRAKRASVSIHSRRPMTPRSSAWRGRSRGVSWSSRTARASRRHTA